MMVLTSAKNANLALLFFIELGVLVALGYWGFHTGPGTLAHIGLGIGVPALAVVVWALFGAPRSVWHLHGIQFFILRVLFFGSAVVALFAASQPVLGIVFALICAVNLTLVYVWKQ